MHLKIRCDGESKKICKIFWELRECLGLLHKLCSINSIVEQLHENWSLWSTSLGALTTLPFFLELSAWSWNRLAKKRWTELKKRGKTGDKHP